MQIALFGEDVSQTESLGTWLCDLGQCVYPIRLATDLISLRTVTELLVLLQLNEVRPSTLSLLRSVRSILAGNTPVVIVAGTNREEQIALALMWGADDYISEPIRPAELLARLAALVRRCYGPFRASIGVLRFGALELDMNERILRVDGTEVVMTPKDMALATLLLNSVGRLVSRAEIADMVWGNALRADSRTVDTHIHRVRHKLRLTPEHGWTLAARYGKGYRLDRT